MPRLLVVGYEIPRLRCVPWEEWKQVNLLDYQGLLLDCRNHSRISGHQELGTLLTRYLQNGHKVFLILPEANEVPPGGLNLGVLPYLVLSVQQQKGKTLTISIDSEFFKSYTEALRGHEIIVDGRLTVRGAPHGWHWQIAVSDNVNRAVCGQFGNAYILHPPAGGRDGVAMKAILDFFHPDFEEPEPDDAPDWSSAVAAAIPGVEAVEAKTANSLKEIARLQSELAVHEAERARLARWAEMLWLDGIPLQKRVSDALKELGVPNQSKDPTGHTQDLEANCFGQSFLFEVTGSTGAIGIEKARQLYQWIGQCDDPTNTKGVLIGNAYRKESPGQRPPTPDHKIFVKEVEDMAQKFHFSLVDIRDLFELILRKLGGEEIKPEAVCEALQADGLVRFPKK